MARAVFEGRGPTAGGSRVQPCGYTRTFRGALGAANAMSGRLASPRGPVDAFWLRVAISFVVGGLSVALFTTAAERLGSRVGGLLLSFPIKSMIALVLIALNEGALVAGEAAGAVPLGIGVNLVFLAATTLLVRRLAPWPAIAGALAAWLVTGLLAVLLLPARAPWDVLAWLVPYVLALAFLPRAHGAKPRKSASRFGLWGLTTRTVGAGTIVALSVVLARFGGPILGGLASVFPSGWITSMVILTRDHGPEFTTGTVRVMIAGSAAPVASGLAAWWLYPSVGILWGTVGAVALALATSLAVGGVLRVSGR